MRRISQCPNCRSLLLFDSARLYVHCRECDALHDSQRLREVAEDEEAD